VNSVHPGPIDIEMLKVRTAEQNRQRLQLVPMKRMGTAEEVASLALFLLSDCVSALIPALQRKASRIGYRPAEASSKPRGGDPG
jgi:NAD(P)-dependent dehydrogenase (short-subunit alcohol dehydrogenase family)